MKINIIFIKILCKEKRYSCCTIIGEFCNKNCNRHGLVHHRQIDKFDSIAWKSESVRPWAECHDDNIDTVADLVQSQEERP